jgi:hypothetical protein
MSQSDSPIPIIEPDGLIIKKTFSDKLSNVIIQKDTLISSLKDTINNLTNIIVNYTKKIELMNLSLNVDIQDINLEASKLDYYIQSNQTLQSSVQHKNNQIAIFSNKLKDTTESYCNLNDSYIYTIQRYQSIIDHMHLKIATLTQYIETIKHTHYHKTDTLVKQYTLESETTLFTTHFKNMKCSQCKTNRINIFNTPCFHCTVCSDCLCNLQETTASDVSDLPKCSLCNVIINGSIPFNNPDH